MVQASLRVLLGQTAPLVTFYTTFFVYRKEAVTYVYVTAAVDVSPYIGMIKILLVLVVCKCPCFVSK